MRSRRTSRQQAPHGHHGAQGRPAPADRHRDEDGKPLDPTTLPEKALSRSRKGRRSRPAPDRQDAARGVRARRTSPVVCRASRRSSRPASRRTRRSSRRSTAGRDPRREEARQARSSCVRARQGIERSTSSRTASTCGAQRATLSGRRAAGRRPARAARHPADLRRGGGAAVPARRDPERLPRQGVTIDDKHIEIIVAQMLRKVRIDEPGRQRLPARARWWTSSASVREHEAHEGEEEARRRPRRFSWASPRPACRATRSSRQPPSRRRPRC
jgi:hypothetical protein